MLGSVRTRASGRGVSERRACSLQKKKYALTAVTFHGTKNVEKREHGKFTSLNEVCFLEPSRTLIAPTALAPARRLRQVTLPLRRGLRSPRCLLRQGRLCSVELHGLCVRGAASMSRRTMAVEPSVGALYSLKRSKKW